LRPEFEAIASRSGDQRAITATKNAGARIDNAIREYAVFQSALATLKNSPNDPAANQVAAVYNCLVQGNWEAGLPMLTKVRAADVRSAATADLAANEDPSSQIAVADGWWALKDSQDVHVRRLARARSLVLYLTQRSNLTGLRKAAVEKRLADLQMDAVFGNGEADPLSQRYKKVVVICDTTGSMMDVLWKVRAEARSVIIQLLPDQRFNLLAFSDVHVNQFSRQLVPASSNNLEAAQRWISNLVAAGSADPIPSFRAAFQQRPDAIFVFSDGFENVTTSDALLDVVRQLNPNHQVAIHSILIRRSPNPQVESVMKQLASENGGELHVVAP
jgi:hypothetical protein